MAKKTRMSLSLKLTLIVVILSAIIIFSLTYFIATQQSKFFDDIFSEKGVALAQSFDASIGFQFNDSLNDTKGLQAFVQNESASNTEIIELSITVPVDNEFTTIASSNTSRIGNPGNTYSNLSFKHGYYYRIPRYINGSHRITVVAPVNLSGRLLGVYEIVLSMDQVYATYDIEVRMLIIVSVISVFLLIFSSLYLLGRTVVKPIIRFRDAAWKIGKGNLNEQIDVKSQDELGDLAEAFNQMTKDLKVSREKIEEYSKTLEKLLDQKDEFIGQLGHDLKNPLTPLVGLLPIIMEQEKDPQLKEHLRIIVHNVDYMQDLVLKTLQLARLRSPATKFDFQPLNLRSEVVNILETQQLFLQQNNMKVDNNIPSSLIIEADRLRFTELFNNLLTNAVKYTPKGGMITLDAKRDDGFAVVSVKDTGIGMTETQISRIFDEFYKADLSRHEMDSSGLGLSIAKRVVERHGGKIWAESKGLGQGSTFFFTLKIADDKLVKE